MKTPGALDRNDERHPERGIGTRLAGRNPNLVEVVDPHGHTYVSLADAARVYRVTGEAIRRRVERGTDGWRRRDKEGKARRGR